MDSQSIAIVVLVLAGSFVAVWDGLMPRSTIGFGVAGVRRLLGRPTLVPAGVFDGRSDLPGLRGRRPVR